MRRVVIVGAGFAGLEAAKTIAHGIRRHALDDIQLTVISDRNYHLFTPLLYQVASGLANPFHVIQPVRNWSGMPLHFIEDRVISVDIAGRCINTTAGKIDYDLLILSPGSETNDFGIKGVTERALFLKRWSDGESVRNRILACLESASKTKDSGEVRRLLTCAVVGGGSSGVELIGSLSDYLKVLTKYYPELNIRKNAKIILIEADSRLVPGLDERISEVCLKILSRRGIEIRLNTKVRSVDYRGIVLENGDVIATGTIVWTAGIRPTKLIADIPESTVEKKNGRIKVDAHLRLKGHTEVFVIGDSAYLEDENGIPVPATASAAIQEGRFVGRYILQLLCGTAGIEDFTFRYRDRGVMLSLGRFEGIAAFGNGLMVKGFGGWLAWRFVHLVYISSMRSRLGIIFDWTVAIFYRRIVSRTDYTQLQEI